MLTNLTSRALIEGDVKPKSFDWVVIFQALSDVWDDLCCRYSEAAGDQVYPARWGDYWVIDRENGFVAWEHVNIAVDCSKAEGSVVNWRHLFISLKTYLGEQVAVLEYNAWLFWMCSSPSTVQGITDCSQFKDIPSCAYLCDCLKREEPQQMRSVPTIERAGKEQKWKWIHFRFNRKERVMTCRCKDQTRKRKTESSFAENFSNQIFQAILQRLL